MHSLQKISIVVALWCLWAASAAPVEEISTLAENYRLPTNIMPTNYKLKLTPYLLESDGSKRFTFDGEVEIIVKPGVSTNKIVMHSKTLQYSARQYWATDNVNNKIPLSNAELNSVTDIITYTLSSALVSSKTYVLHFKYTGKMEDDMHGFYRSSYVDSQNNTIWLASTQFQTHHARRAFPCFDEPKFKATFDLTIVRHVSMDSFSNTRLVSTVYDGMYATDTYKTSPPMSTYLVAFMVSNFGVRYNGDFGIIARREFYDQTEYSFEVGKKLLEALEDYFGLKYYDQGINKMHMAALPDFSAGAMENWGLLTYRERNLLFKENFTTLSAKQAIAAVIAHEQTHMWFGDLVTCDWWSYTWLNEGFARYFQYFGTALVEKDMIIDMQFVVDQLQSVMNMDSTKDTNPMTDENTNTPADLSRMFNSISYNKGAVLIRMVRHILGEENFRKSLQDYLKTYKKNNVKPENIFEAWKIYWPTQFSGSADSFFSTYTTQVGYPVVHINVSDDGKSFDVHQERFLLKENDGADKNLLYTVPFTYTTNLNANFTDTAPKMFLPASTVKTHVQLPDSITWIIANIQEMGYYRVNYGEKYWHKIHESLNTANWGGIHEINRAQIVDDLLNLARPTIISYDLALGVLDYLKTETAYLPWKAAITGFNYLQIRFGTDKNDFAQYIRMLTEEAYKTLGFEEKSTDTALDIYNRAQILSWSCKYGNADCISKSLAHFDRMDAVPVPVNIRSAVYCTILREGQEIHYDRFVEKYKTEDVATEQTLLLNSLGCVKHSKLVEKQFWFIISDNVRRQDKSAALSSLYTSNNENISPVFDLVTKNHEELAKSMGGYSNVASAISGIAARFTTENQKKDLENFNKENGSKFGDSMSTLTKAEVTIQENLEWASKNINHISTFMRSYYESSSASVSFVTFTTIAFFAIAAIVVY